MHGPLCARLDGLGFYVQHHFARQADGVGWQTDGGLPPLAGYELDGIVEIGHAGAADQQRFTDVSPVLFGDERNFIGHDVAYALPNGSTTALDREVDPTPNHAEPLDRVHVHWSARPEQREALGAFLRDRLVPLLIDAPGIVKVRLHLPESYVNAEPAPAAPLVDHVLPDELLRVGALEVAFADTLARRRFLDSDAYRATLDDQARVASHVTAFRVTGVYTFIRDGELTPAGLRGSRGAELIGRLGAANQLDTAVSARFV